MAHLVRYHRFPNLANDLLNDEFWGGRLENNSSSPAVNIIEDENNYTLEYSVPGFSKEDLKVAVDNNVITVSHKAEEQKEDQPKYLKKEFTKGGFERSFELPKNIEAGSIEAKHENGILTVSVPKKAKVEIPVHDVEVK